MSTTEDHRVDLEPGEIGIDLASAADGNPVLFLRGEIDAATVGRLVACFDAIVRGGATRCTVSFGDVTFMDSSGVNALLELRRALGPAARLHLRDCSTSVQRMCAITGLADVDGVTVT